MSARRICAWCKLDMGPAPANCAGDTHGMCRPCLDAFDFDPGPTGRMHDPSPNLQNIPIRTETPIRYPATISVTDHTP